MNERIKELAREAGFIINVSANADRQIQQLTESIVRECADIASDVGTDTVPTDFALDKCYEIESKIKERFGVK